MVRDFMSWDGQTSILIIWFLATFVIIPALLCAGGDRNYFNALRSVFKGEAGLLAFFIVLVAIINAAIQLFN